MGDQLQVYFVTHKCRGSNQDFIQVNKPQRYIKEMGRKEKKGKEIEASSCSANKRDS